ncbi:MAG TPA: proton-conducting transporter membrane subunit, partial [Roseiflexaceae bacterium]|nr:proton-conducting transporter membrane subunit [Roseiflexaceae bacterium]
MPDQIPAPAIDYRVILQLVIVFGWAAAQLIVGLFVPRERSRLLGYMALVGIAVAAIAGVPLWNSNALTFNNMIALDNYGLAMNWIFLLSAAITIAISLEYLSRHGIERSEYYSLLLFATGGMMLLAQGTDLIVLFLGLETLSITLYVLAGFAYPRLSSEEAAMKYLLIGAFGAGFLVFGIALLYGATGASNLAEIGGKI